jgi:hypothetical protein
LGACRFGEVDKANRGKVHLYRKLQPLRREEALAGSENCAIEESRMPFGTIKIPCVKITTGED